MLQIGKESDRTLDLVKINSAQKQVVAGLNYVLVVETAVGGDKETYEAKVYGKPATQDLELQTIDSIGAVTCSLCMPLNMPKSACNACFHAEPLGNQPLKLTSHKKIDDQAAQRKTEESSERSSGALLGGYREVSLLMLLNLQSVTSLYTPLQAAGSCQKHCFNQTAQ